MATLAKPAKNLCLQCLDVGCPRWRADSKGFSIFLELRLQLFVDIGVERQGDGGDMEHVAGGYVQARFLVD